MKQPIIPGLEAKSCLPRSLIPHLIYGPRHPTNQSATELPSDERADKQYQRDRFGLPEMSESTSCKATQTQQQPQTGPIDMKNTARMTRPYPKKTKVACNYCRGKLTLELTNRLDAHLD